VSSRGYNAEFRSTLARVRAGDNVTRDDLALLLEAPEGEAQDVLHAVAYEVKSREVGRVVYLRGLIEMSNVCRRNCNYCGIRRDNRDVDRFTLTAKEIVAGAVRAHKFGYGSVVLQGGERQDPGHIAFITDILARIHAATRHELAITLSLGEQTEETYRRWREAGAHRYLLRMETTDADLYLALHPDDPDRESRRRCLDFLRDEGYHVGTGVMIGLPGQTTQHLAEDLLFFRDQDVDMIGMGPFIPHDDTPLGGHAAGFDGDRQVQLGLNMIACTRLLLPNANIASTTALQALHDRGRELGLLAGGNVIMPNVTDTKFRAAYQLYNGKPSLQENAAQTRLKLDAAIARIGETIGYGEKGHAPRALTRRNETVLKD